MGIGPDASSPSELHPAIRRCLAGMHRSAIRAGACLLIGIEGLVDGRQVAHDAFQRNLDPLDQPVAYHK